MRRQARGVCLAACAWLVAAPAVGALTEASRVAAVYDTIFQARFDAVESQLKQTCPPAPTEACQTLRVVAAWWQIQINPEAREFDARFNDLAATSIVASEAWTRREPERAEAWFYLAASYAPLVQWQVLRGERLAAARNGNKIREWLERALKLDPNLQDAKFGIGLYHYYAAVAPAAAKLLRFMLFMPGGDRVLGLKEMEQARDRGDVLGAEADYQLQLIFLWYEKRPLDGLQILKRLDARYGHNPLFLAQIATVHDSYYHDHPGSAEAWSALIARAKAGGVYDAVRSEARGHLGLAQQLDAMFETDRAIDELKDMLGARSGSLPAGVRARAELQLGEGYDRLGERELAEQAYAAAVNDAPPLEEGRQVREQARAALREKPDPRAAESYRLSLDGWRALERGSVDDAEAALTRAIALAPSDTVARYRYACVLRARGDTARAREELERVITSASPAPAIVLASALVDDARLLEDGGNRILAVMRYQRAVDIVGADPRVRDTARRALTRLRPTARE